jgi:hypothetical protein
VNFRGLYHHLYPVRLPGEGLRLFLGVYADLFPVDDDLVLGVETSPLYTPKTESYLNRCASVARVGEVVDPTTSMSP